MTDTPASPWWTPHGGADDHHDGNGDEQIGGPERVPHNLVESAQNRREAVHAFDPAPVERRVSDAGT